MRKKVGKKKRRRKMMWKKNLETWKKRKKIEWTIFLLLYGDGHSKFWQVI